MKKLCWAGLYFLAVSLLLFGCEPPLIEEPPPLATTVAVAEELSLTKPPTPTTGTLLDSPLPTPTPSRWGGPTPVPTDIPPPTATPTLAPTDTPLSTATPTLRPLPTVPGPLPSGLKFLYSETEATQSYTTLWVASVDNLDARKELAVVGPHKEGYSVAFRLSPDESKVAYTVIPPGTSERGARTAGSELWVMDADGTHPRKLADRVGHLIAWSPDSKALLYQRLVSLEKPKDPNVPFRTDWHLISVDGSGEELFLSDDTATGIMSVGYSSDGHSFYYLARISGEPAGIWEIDVMSKKKHLKTIIDVKDPWQPLAISPDRTRLLLSCIASREPVTVYDLVIVFLDGRENVIVLSGAAGDRPGDHPLNQYAASWTPDGQHLRIRTPMRQGEPSKIQIMDLHSRESRTLLTNPTSGEEFYSIGRCSPDGKWLVTKKYSQVETQVYLMPSEGGNMRRIPASRPSHWIYLVGWITDSLTTNTK